VLYLVLLTFIIIVVHKWIINGLIFGKIIVKILHHPFSRDTVYVRVQCYLYTYCTAAIIYCEYIRHNDKCLEGCKLGCSCVVQVEREECDKQCCQGVCAACCKLWQSQSTTFYQPGLLFSPNIVQPIRILKTAFQVEFRYPSNALKVKVRM